MFNIGGGELIVIMLIALIVLGPQRLPDAARQIGKTMGDLRRLSTGFQNEMKSALDVVEDPTRVSARRNVLAKEAPVPADDAPADPVAAPTTIPAVMSAVASVSARPPTAPKSPAPTKKATKKASKKTTKAAPKKAAPKKAGSTPAKAASPAKRAAGGTKKSSPGTVRKAPPRRTAP